MESPRALLDDIISEGVVDGGALATWGSRTKFDQQSQR